MVSNRKRPIKSACSIFLCGIFHPPLPPEKSNETKIFDCHGMWLKRSGCRGSEEYATFQRLSSQGDPNSCFPVMQVIGWWVRGFWRDNMQNCCGAYRGFPYPWQARWKEAGSTLPALDSRLLSLYISCHVRRRAYRSLCFDLFPVAAFCCYHDTFYSSAYECMVSMHSVPLVLFKSADSPHTDIGGLQYPTVPAKVRTVSDRCTDGFRAWKACHGRCIVGASPCGTAITASSSAYFSSSCCCCLHVCRLRIPFGWFDSQSAPTAETASLIELAAKAPAMEQPPGELRRDSYGSFPE